MRPGNARSHDRDGENRNISGGGLAALSQTVYKQLCSIDGGYGPRPLASR